jgi:hypothetical protein
MALRAWGATLARRVVSSAMPSRGLALAARPRPNQAGREGRGGAPSSSKPVRGSDPAFQHRFRAHLQQSERGSSSPRGGKGQRGGRFPSKREGSATLFIDANWLSWHSMVVARRSLFGEKGSMEGMEHTFSVKALVDALLQRQGNDALRLSGAKAYTSLPLDASDAFFRGLSDGGVHVEAWPGAVVTPSEDGPGFASAPSAASLVADAALEAQGTAPTEVIIVGSSPAYARLVSGLASLGKAVSVACTRSEWEVFRGWLHRGGEGVHFIELDEVFPRMFQLGAVVPEVVVEEEEAVASGGSEGEKPAADDGRMLMARDLARALTEEVRATRPVGTSGHGGTFVTLNEVSLALVKRQSLLNRLRHTGLTALQLASQSPTVMRVLKEDEREAAQRHMAKLSARARGGGAEKAIGEDYVLEVLPKRLWKSPVHESDTETEKPVAAAEEEGGGSVASPSRDGEAVEEEVVYVDSEGNEVEMGSDEEWEYEVVEEGAPAASLKDLLESKNTSKVHECLLAMWAGLVEQGKLNAEDAGTTNRHLRSMLTARGVTVPSRWKREQLLEALCDTPPQE